MIHKRELKIAEVRTEGTDAINLTFVAKDEEGLSMPFVPGQYLTLRADVNARELWRSYSITSDPGDLETVSVLVRRVNQGAVSNWICDNLKSGDTLEVYPPAGSFNLVEDQAPAAFFAGGSGIAPIFSLIRQALKSGAPRVCLFYANRSAETEMLGEDIDALRDAYPEQFRCQRWFDEGNRFPKASDIKEFLGDRPVKFAYVCGPEPFMKLVQVSLEQAGYPSTSVIMEIFDTETQVPVDVDGEAKSHTLQIEKSGKVTEVEIPSGQTILDGLAKVGVDAPHSCKVGECAACMCRLVDGEIDCLPNSVLDEDDKDDGWILPCRSTPVSTFVKIRYE